MSWAKMRMWRNGRRARLRGVWGYLVLVQVQLSAPQQIDGNTFISHLFVLLLRLFYSGPRREKNMEDKKIVKLRNQQISLNLIREDDGYLKIKALANEQDVASASFKLKKGKCFLNRIEILNSKYSHIGLGSQILKFIEEIACEANCFCVEGKFYPFGELGVYAKDFYIRNGYVIEKEYYETYISKFLNKTTKKKEPKENKNDEQAPILDLA